MKSKHLFLYLQPQFPNLKASKPDYSPVCMATTTGFSEQELHLSDVYLFFYEAKQNNFAEDQRWRMVSFREKKS